MAALAPAGEEELVEVKLMESAEAVTFFLGLVWQEAVIEAIGSRLTVVHRRGTAP